MVEVAGLEPATSRIGILRSIQMSYTSVENLLSLLLQLNLANRQGLLEDSSFRFLLYAANPLSWSGIDWWSRGESNPGPQCNPCTFIHKIRDNPYLW